VAKTQNVIFKKGANLMAGKGQTVASITTFRACAKLGLTGLSENIYELVV
jgi:hypothetical protein